MRYFSVKLHPRSFLFFGSFVSLLGSTSSCPGQLISVHFLEDTTSQLYDIRIQSVPLLESKDGFNKSNTKNSTIAGVLLLDNVLDARVLVGRRQAICNVWIYRVFDRDLDALKDVYCKSFTSLVPSSHKTVKSIPGIVCHLNNLPVKHTQICSVIAQGVIKAHFSRLKIKVQDLIVTVRKSIHLQIFVYWYKHVPKPWAFSAFLSSSTIK
jgi:hypothetical protein